MQSYLKITYADSSGLKSFGSDKNSEFEYRVTPFCSSEIYKCSIVDCTLLTEDDSRKIYNLKLSSEKNIHNFEPGSTIGVLPSNNEKLVEDLIMRLGIEDVAHQDYKLEVISTGAKKNPSLPKHIPGSSTLQNVLLYYVDIKSIPKKIFLKSLLHFMDDVKEYEELKHVCSPQGSDAYNKLISDYSKRSLLGLLNHFPSCKPPIEKLLEFLPPLLPRYYSISSSPLIQQSFSITFDVKIFDNDEAGVCSGWLEKCINNNKFKESQVVIPIYHRTQTNFKLVDNNLTPIIMIGTGTGISPFRAFLEHRHLEITSQNVSFGESWLFYGCRDSGKNYLFKEDLQLYLKSGSLSRLFESFSRETNEKNYVQCNIEKYGKEICDLIVGKGAIVYVCGDFQKVLPSVERAILNILMKYQASSIEVIDMYFSGMVKDGRYIVENWT